MRLNQAGTRVLTSCLPLMDPPLAVGAPCGALNECELGSSCWGPPDLDPIGWGGDFRCRRVCSPSQALPSGADAGRVETEQDAGVQSLESVCGNGGQCRDLSEAGLETSGLGESSGYCD
jgi:hypothetical protein